MKKQNSRSSSRASAFNQSRVKLFLRCQKAYWFRYDSHGVVNGELVPKHSSLPLKKGSWCHTLLQAHWLETIGQPVVLPKGKRGKKKVQGWEEAQDHLANEFAALFEEEQDKYGDLPGECERLFRGYLRRYSDDTERYRIATLPNGKPAVEFVVEVPLQKWGLGAPFKGRIDLMVEDLEYGDLWIRDAKWVKTMPGDDERMMSPQNLLYFWGARRAYSELEERLRGFIYDYGRTKTPSIPDILKRPAGFVTIKKSIDTDVYTYLARVLEAHGRDEAKKLIKEYYAPTLRMLRAKEKAGVWYRRERVPISEERLRRGLQEFIVTCRQIERRPRSIAPRTYLYSCKWNCSYHNICVAEFNGMDIDPLVKRHFVIEEETYKAEESDLIG